MSVQGRRDLLALVGLTLLLLLIGTSCAMGSITTPDGRTVRGMALGHAAVSLCTATPPTDVGPEQPACAVVTGGDLSSNFELSWAAAMTMLSGVLLIVLPALL